MKAWCGECGDVTDRTLFARGDEIYVRCDGCGREIFLGLEVFDFQTRDCERCGKRTLWVLCGYGRKYSICLGCGGCIKVDAV